MSMKSLLYCAAALLTPVSVAAEPVNILPIEYNMPVQIESAEDIVPDASVDGIAEATASSLIVPPSNESQYGPVIEEVSEDGWDRVRDIEHAYLFMSLVDAVSTWAFLNEGYTEQNPIYGSNPSNARLVGIKVASGAIHYLLVREIARDHPEIARIVSITSLVLQSGVVAWNLHLVM